MNRNRTFSPRVAGITNILNVRTTAATENRPTTVSVIRRLVRAFIAIHLWLRSSCAFSLAHSQPARTKALYRRSGHNCTCATPGSPNHRPST